MTRLWDTDSRGKIITHMLPFAPGARAVIRDEEWLIRRANPSTDGGWLLTCDRISELVRSQSALFLTHLENAIEVLDPETTVLVSDTSPTCNATRSDRFACEVCEKIASRKAAVLLCCMISIRLKYERSPA